MICSLDLLWTLSGISTGSLAYGLIDEPAHLATCMLALLALHAMGVRLSPALCAAALLASVAIDVDHIPGYLSWDGLIGDAPRPYIHSALSVLILLGFGFLAPRRYKPVMFGLALGVSAHLLRDVATGPGVPLSWPLPGVVAVPYGAFAVLLLVLAAVAVMVRARPANLHTRPGVAIVVALFGLLAVPMLSAPSAHAYRVSVGGYIPNADNHPGLIQEFAGRIGRQPAIILLYKDFDQEPFVYDQLDGIANQGAIPLVTWEAWDSSGTGVSLYGIAAGDYDGYLRDAARAAAGWGQPLMIRFAQEMNADWFPWGLQPAVFRAAWRHMVRLFRAEGATNVRWIWTPYVNSGGEYPFKRYYPGAKYVDWVGLDGINWGGSFAWRSFGQMFRESYRQLLRFSCEPMMLAETGSGESGGYKASWLARMLRWRIPRMSHVRAIVFWSVADHRGDIRIDSSEAALGALQGALQKPLYRSSREAVIATPASLDRSKHRKHERIGRSDRARCGRK